ncbi:Hpt domain-containing protein [Rhodobacter sp. NTK016B]|uniref:Hpt domain-containing protein n=1 Tax=Rhodobacter sp. NTK016B TaxID=2759676 RepID=UPI001A8D5837|nr:Hpt domain-containing protein [Rhodobacter sp. NTK016B]MBN8292909.1 Hpt domain-containing protein [Rhodobacter sp. NTK016B]
MDNSQRQLSAAIDRLRPRYVSTMTEYSERLTAALDEQAHVGPNDTALEEIRFVAHRLAGTAESFGWGEIGAHASHVDTLMEGCDAETCDSHRHLTPVRRLRDMLLKAIRVEAAPRRA